MLLSHEGSVLRSMFARCSQGCWFIGRSEKESRFGRVRSRLRTMMLLILLRWGSRRRVFSGDSKACMLARTCSVYFEGVPPTTCRK